MLRGKGRALTRVSGFRGVSEGFRWFQRVSDADAGFRWFQRVSEGFRRFQRVSNADAVSSFLVSSFRSKE